MNDWIEAKNIEITFKEIPDSLIESFEIRDYENTKIPVIKDPFYYCRNSDFVSKTIGISKWTKLEFKDIYIGHGQAVLKINLFDFNKKLEFIFPYHNINSVNINYDG